MNGDDPAIGGAEGTERPMVLPQRHAGDQRAGDPRIEFPVGDLTHRETDLFQFRAQVIVDRHQVAMVVAPCRNAHSPRLIRCGGRPGARSVGHRQPAGIPPAAVTLEWTGGVRRGLGLGLGLGQDHRRANTLRRPSLRTRSTRSAAPADSGPPEHPARSAATRSRYNGGPCSAKVPMAETMSPDGPRTNAGPARPRPRDSRSRLATDLASTAAGRSGSMRHPGRAGSGWSPRPGGTAGSRCPGGPGCTGDPGFRSGPGPGPRPAGLDEQRSPPGTPERAAGRRRTAHGRGPASATPLRTARGIGRSSTHRK